MFSRFSRSLPLLSSSLRSLPSSFPSSSSSFPSFIPSYSYLFSRSILTLVHPKFITSEYIEAFGNKLLKDRHLHPSHVTEFLNIYKTEMKLENFIFFLNKVGKRRLLQPYHIYIVACGIKYVDDGNASLSLNQFDSLFQNMAYMSGKIGGVRCLIQVITEKLKENNEILSSYRIGHYLNSLRLMKSGHKEVREMIELLTYKIQNMNQFLSLNDFCRGVGAMRYLSSRYPEIRSLLATLTKKLNETTELTFTSGNLVILLPGLHRLNGEIQEVQEFILAIKKKIDPITLLGWNEKEVRQSLHGIGEKEINHIESKDIYEIIQQILSSSLPFDPYPAHIRSPTSVLPDTLYPNPSYVAVKSALERLNGYESNYPELCQLLTARLGKNE